MRRMRTNTADEDRQHEVIHGPIVAEADQPKQAAARYALQAVLAAGEVRLQTDEKHQLRQRQGDHREINSLTAHRDRADHQAQQHARPRRRRVSLRSFPNPEPSPTIP